MREIFSTKKTTTMDRSTYSWMNICAAKRQPVWVKRFTQLAFSPTLDWVVETWDGAKNSNWALRRLYLDITLWKFQCVRRTGTLRKTRTPSSPVQRDRKNTSARSTNPLGQRYAETFTFQTSMLLRLMCHIFTLFPDMNTLNPIGYFTKWRGNSEPSQVDKYRHHRTNFRFLISGGLFLFL